jgi:hypothetical protein
MHPFSEKYLKRCFYNPIDLIVALSIYIFLNSVFFILMSSIEFSANSPAGFAGELPKSIDKTEHIDGFVIFVLSCAHEYRHILMCVSFFSLSLILFLWPFRVSGQTSFTRADFHNDSVSEALPNVGNNVNAAETDRSINKNLEQSLRGNRDGFINFIYDSRVSIADSIFEEKERELDSSGFILTSKSAGSLWNETSDVWTKQITKELSFEIHFVENSFEVYSQQLLKKS